MAFNDTLFQLGMDLTRSSTAQEEDRRVAAHVAHEQDRHDATQVAHEDRKDFFIERDGLRYAGTHLLVDLFGARRLDDIEHIQSTLKRCVEVAGATLLHIHLHHFTPNGGVSGVAVLSESHISIHTWPERDFASIDIFMCGACDPYDSLPALKAAFAPATVNLNEQRRGLIT